jgi:tetratricopeptide (TPR) repeat protein
MSIKSIRTIFILLLCLIPLDTFAQSSQLLFNEANRLYTAGNYEQSVEKYHEIVRNGFESGALYFNMGNAYYKLGKIGESILFYEKALKLIPGDEALQRNIQIARLKTVDKIEPIPSLFLEIWWKEAINLFSLNTYSWLSLSTFFSLALMIAIYLVFRKDGFRYFIWVNGICFIVFLLLFLGKIYENENNRFGIIMSKTVSVVSEPAISSTEMFILHEGTKVKINRTVEGWYEISLADGKTGWMQIEGIAQI